MNLSFLDIVSIQKIKVSFISFILLSFSLLSLSAFAIEHDQRPTDLEYALMSKYAYNDPSTLKKNKQFDDLPGWKVYKTITGSNDYQGVVFKKNVDNIRELVLAHRGTDPKKIGTIKEDIQSILAAVTSPQELEAFTAIKELVEYAREENYHLSFTGHSLGAFLAELSVFFCHSSNEIDYPETNAVVFDSPGSKRAIEELQSKLPEEKILTKNMDILVYVSTPNIINTLNEHYGSLYLIEPSLNQNGYWKIDPTWYTMESHSMDNIVKYFKDNYAKSTLFSRKLSDWPAFDWNGLKNFINCLSNVKISEGFSLKNIFYSVKSIFAVFSPSQKDIYFKHANWNESCKCYSIKLQNKANEEFDLTYNAHYQTDNKHNSDTSLPLRHFSKDMQQFLKYFNKTVWGVGVTDENRKKLAEKWKEAGIPPEITTYLVGLRIKENSKGNVIVDLSDINFETNMDATPIHKFRSELSEYLKNNHSKIKEMLSVIDSDNTVYAAFLGEDAELIGDIKEVVYVGVHMPAPSVDDKIKLLKSLHKEGVSIKSYVIAPGAKVKGNIEGGIFIGVNFDSSDKLESLIKNTFNFKQAIEPIKTTELPDTTEDTNEKK